MNTFEGLLFQNNHFFSAIFFQSSYFFRANFLPTNHTLRIGNSLVQLPFGTVTNRSYLQKRYFFEADSIAQHQLFQKSKILEKATFSKKQYSAFRIFLDGYLFNNFFINHYLLQNSYIFTTYLFRGVTISQVPLFSTATLPISQSVTE